MFYYYITVTVTYKNDSMWHEGNKNKNIGNCVLKMLDRRVEDWPERLTYALQLALDYKVKQVYYTTVYKLDSQSGKYFKLTM